LKAEVLQSQTVQIGDEVRSFTSGNFEVFRKQAVAPSLEPRTGKAISSSGEFWQREAENTEKKTYILLVKLM
jgi:hypothetical protein